MTSMSIRPWISELSSGSRMEYPVGTLIFYGPDNRHASKLVASVCEYEGAEPILRK